MGFWKPWRVAGQGEAEVDAGLDADISSDVDALDHDEQDVFESLGADPDDVAGIMRDPIARNEDPANAVVADIDAHDRDRDRTGDSFTHRSDDDPGTT